MNILVYRPMQPDEAAAVCALVERSFNRFVAPGYSPEGCIEFLRYAQPEALLERSHNRHFVLVAASGAHLAGVLEVRDFEHVSLLFVDEAYQRRGISRELFNRALDICRRERPGLAQVTVNSSPYAVPVYERLGFHSTAAEQEHNGIRFRPMTLEVHG
jgi:GNAT superfamily N-acetyltransferase